MCCSILDIIYNGLCIGGICSTNSKLKKQMNKRMNTTENSIDANPSFVAVYILQSKSLSVLVPKKSGKGFCKRVLS